MSGEDFNLENDEAILKINSPQRSLKGPYAVVYKNTEERWAIVAMNWNGEPNLGIRWFWGKSGNPISRSYPTWFIIPSMLRNEILNSLPLDSLFRDNLNRFLMGEISGNQLNKGE